MFMEPGSVAVGAGTVVELVTIRYVRKQANITLSANKPRRTQRFHTLCLIPINGMNKTGTIVACAQNQVNLCQNRGMAYSVEMQ